MNYDPYGDIREALMNELRGLAGWQNENFDNEVDAVLDIVEEALNAPENSARKASSIELVAEWDAIHGGPDEDRKALIASILTERTDEVAKEWKS